MQPTSESRVINRWIACHHAPDHGLELTSKCRIGLG